MSAAFIFKFDVELFEKFNFMLILKCCCLEPFIFGIPRHFMRRYLSSLFSLNLNNNDFDDFIRYFCMLLPVMLYLAGYRENLPFRLISFYTSLYNT